MWQLLSTFHCLITYGNYWAFEVKIKRGSISSPLIIRARINSGEPEPIRVLRSTKAPELDEIFRGVPTRFSTNLFQKVFRVVSISKEKGINVFHCTTDVMERR